MIVDASGTVTSWERVGQLASQLADCAADLERFLLGEMTQLHTIQRRLDDQVCGARRRFHPGSNDPVISAVLTRFEQLERAAGQSADG